MPEEESKKEKVQKEKIHKRVHAKLKKSGWKIATVALLALLLISMFTGGFKDFFFKTGKQGAAEQAVTYINTNLLQKGTNAVLEGVSDEGDFYEVSLKIDEKKFDSYVTKDGKYLIPAGKQAFGLYIFDMTEEVETVEQPTQTQTQSVQKSDKPVAQAFVFSYCPYGLQFQKALLPVYKMLKNKVNIELVAIGAMHGEYEKQESLRQVCIENKYNKDRLWAYLERFMGETKIGNCRGDTTCSDPLVEQIMAQLGIDKKVINECMAKDAESLYQSQNGEASGLGISGSPTFVINGVEIQVGRNPEAIKKVICDSFNTPPTECSQTLSTATPSAGFGAGTSGSSGGGCG